MKNPYEVLGLPTTATQKQIKQAFYKLSKQWHPDKFQDENEKIKAMEMQIELNRAYSILGDPIKKESFNKTGFATKTPKELIVRDSLLNFMATAYDSFMGFKPNGRDVISKVRSLILQKKGDIDRDRRLVNGEVNKAKSFEGKVFSTSVDGENLFDMIREQKLRLMQERLEQMREAEELLDECLVKLREYKGVEDFSDSKDNIKGTILAGHKIFIGDGK